MTILQEFKTLDGVEVNKKYLLFLSSNLQKEKHYDEARRVAFVASQLQGDEVVKIQLTPNGLNGIPQINLAKEALNGYGGLNPGYQFLKGGEIFSEKEEIENCFSIVPDYLQKNDCPYHGLNKKVTTDDIYQYITDLMVNTIEDIGHLPWQQKWDKTQTLWDGKQALNFESRKPYRGINFWMVNFKPKYDAKEDKWYLVPRDLTVPYFLTFNQIEKNKGKLKKGSKGTRVYYFTKLYIFREVKKDGKDLEFSSYKLSKVVSWILKNKNKISSLKGKKPEDLISYLPILKYYNVFHGADVEGIQWPGVPKTMEKPKSKIERIGIAESIVKNMPNAPEILYKGNQPAYYPSFDHIRMTPIEAFEGAEEYHSTLFHELVHATGHKSRLSRPGITLGKLGTKMDYAKEELVAEMGAVFLSSEAGILHKVKENSAKYLAGWNRRLVSNMKEDNKFFFRASSQAQAAADFILDRDSNGVPKYQKETVSTEDPKAEETPKVKSKAKAPKKTTNKKKPTPAKKEVVKKEKPKATPKPKQTLPLQINYPISQIETRNQPDEKKVAELLENFDLNKLDPVKVYENTDRRSVTLVEGINRLEAVKRLNYDNAPVVYVSKPKERVKKPKKKKEQLELFEGLSKLRGSVPGLRPMGANVEKNPLFKIGGETGKFLQAVERKQKESVVVVLSTPPGTGKTTACYQFANDLAKDNPTLFLSLEEHPSSNLAIEKRDKYISATSQNNISTAGEVPDKPTLCNWINHHEVVIIDSWQKLVAMLNGLKLDEDLRKAFDGKLFIIIVQETVDGKPKGGAAMVFDGDIVTKGHKGEIFAENYLFHTKNRYTNVPLETLFYNISKGKVYNPTQTDPHHNTKPVDSDWLKVE